MSYQYRSEFVQLLMDNIIYNNIINISFDQSPNFLETSLYERNPIRHVITDEVKNTLQPIKYCQAIDKENHTACAITFDSFQENEDIIQLPCKHCFTIEPIMKWLTEESCECPVCRYRFESMEKKNVESVTNRNTNSNNYHSDYLYDGDYDNTISF